MIQQQSEQRTFIIKWVATAAFMGITACVGIILFWLYSVPMKAIDVTPNPIPVITKTATPGSYIVLKYSYCKNVKSAGRVSISMVSTTSQLMLPTARESSEKKCYSSVLAPFPIPPQATPGVYHYHFRAIYQVNPLRSITQDYDTQPFTVQ